MPVIKRISDTMTSLGRKITSHTVESYISALTDSFIFYPVQRYDAKGKQLLKTGDAEIDFVVINGIYKAYYQVSLSVREETTMQRELSPLLSISDNFPKYLLTLDNDPVTFHDGIKQQYVLDWLME